MGIESAVGTALARGAGLIAFGWRKLFPRKVGYALAPSNILEVITPYVYKEKVLELLGQPHSFQNGIAGYRFANALLQVTYEDELVRNVVLVATRLWWPNRFKIFPFDYAIGKTRFGEVCELAADGTLPMRVDFSAKFYILWKPEYFGFSGRYMTYGFASVSAATYPQLTMPDEKALEYETLTAEPEPRSILRRPNDVRFNAVMVSASEEEHFPFIWSIFS